jgi:2-polyprenyl-3-methyl-5-hydroxy-6-metoxy-1,4-benzoquinol methylase
MERVSCLVCGGERSKLYGRKFGLDLVKCRDCGLVYAHPRLPAGELEKRYESPLFFDDYLKNLRATPGGYDPAFVKSHFHLTLGLLERRFAPGKRLLDVGCGAGFFIKAAEEAGWEAVGIEVSKLSSRYGREIVRADVRTGRLEDAGFAPASFDMVTMLDLVEHLPDPLATLRAASAVLKPGGILIVSTPDFRSLSGRILGRSWAVFSPGEHLAVFNARTLAMVLNKAGFRVQAMKNLFVLNPAYTHDPERRPTRTFRRIHSRLEKTRFMDHLHGFEFLDLFYAGEKGAPHIAGLGPAKRLARGAYRRAKRWLRGDILVALALKPAAKEGPA